MNYNKISVFVQQKNGYEMPRVVGIIYSDVKREYFPTEAQYLTEKDALHDSMIVSKYLELMGIQPVLFPGNETLSEKLRKARPDMVINLVDSVKGYEYLSSAIPGILEVLDIPYTGADILAKSLDTNKFLIKKLLQQNGVPVPNYQLFNTQNDPLDSTIRFPLISKLNEIHGSVEITKDAVSENEKHLRERLKFLITTYSQPVLAEEFIVGREVAAILLEGLNKKVYFGEKIFPNKEDKYQFATFDEQWKKDNNPTYFYQKYEDNLLQEYIRKAFDITRMADYAKFDIRIDQSGRYYFIDCNNNPSFGPKELDVAMASILDIYGITFQEILKRLIQNTMRDAIGKERLPVFEKGEVIQQTNQG